MNKKYSNEEMTEFIDTYNKLNNSFKKKCVFTVGHSAGFFSEINNMIFAMIYCLKNQIKFILYTKTANFANTEGWKEFFEPFCKEFGFKIIPFVNRHTGKPKYSMIKYFNLFSSIFKFRHGISYLTYDIWIKFKQPEFFHQPVEIKELGIAENGCMEASSKLAQMLWRFNDQTKKEVDEIINSINLPEKYLAVHVRAGDKIIEFNKLIKTKTFMEKLKTHSDLKDVFVFADDYRQVEQLRNEYQDYNFYSLCQPDEKGYFNTEFQSMDWDIKKKGLLKLFANVEICRNSDFFVGSVQANPDFFITFFMENNFNLLLKDE